MDGEGNKHVLEPTNHPIDRHPDIIVTDADMRLIEAAPELLSSLRQCAAILEEEIGNLVDAHTNPTTGRIDEQDVRRVIEEEQAIYARAVAIIVKIEGRK